MAEYGLTFDPIEENEIHEVGLDRESKGKHETGAFCDVCLLHNLIASSKNLAFYLCYLCELYMCDYCFKGHESHKHINLVSEKSERETGRRNFLGIMRKEGKREEIFDREKVSMIDRVNVKNELDDKDCWIYGICGLDNTKWVVCDNNNHCIKIYNVGSNLLQRYIRLGSQPWDVTEMQVKSEPTEPGGMSTVDFSVTNQGKQGKQCLLAVTLPWKRRVLMIDVAQNPAVIAKTISTEKDCYSIDLNGEHIVTVCNDGHYVDGPWFVIVMSRDGVTIKTINIDVHNSLPWYYLAVCSGSFYITNPTNHSVVCLNGEGKEVSHKIIEGSRPHGISVDPDTKLIYICARLNDKLYRLKSTLESSELLFDFKSVNSDLPWALCLHRDKLYVSHGPVSTHQNCVTVIRVL